MHPSIVKALQSAISKLHSEQPVVVKKEKKKYEPTEKDLFIQQCFREFETIHRATPVRDINGDVIGRFIEYNGQKVDEVEYAQKRLNEWVNENK
jgi:hypothetical protein